MKQTKIGIIVFAMLNLVNVFAQENSVAGGSEASGTGGTVSYTIGQVVYTTNTGTNGSVSQGVQQTYEISSVSGVNEHIIQLDISVFPNPTTHYLTLQVEDFTHVNKQQLIYQLIDQKGKIITKEEILASSTNINMEQFPSATYFLNITKDNQLIQSFQIIKN